MSDEFFIWLETQANKQIAEDLHEIATHFAATLFRKLIKLEPKKEGFEYRYTAEDGFIMSVEGRMELDATNPTRIICGMIEIAIPVNNHENDKFELIYDAEIDDKTGRFYWAPVNSSIKIDVVFEAHRNADTMVGETIKQLRTAGLHFN